jgi:hypothetical protein
LKSRLCSLTASEALLEEQLAVGSSFGLVLFVSISNEELTL